MNTVGSLCTGFGGLELALKLAGWPTRTLWHADNHPAAATLLAHRWPDIPNLGDITAVDWTTVERPDVLCAGFPCQDMSAAGRRAGIQPGTRSGLWITITDVINVLQPAILVIENVEGILSATAHRGLGPSDPYVEAAGDHALRALGCVLGDLADLGYDAIWYGLPAAAVGAPHRRFRIFLIAVPQDGDGWAAVPAGHRPAAGSGGAAADTESQRHGHCGTSAGGGVPAVAVAGGAGPSGMSLLPTPAAADGDRVSYCCGRGNPPLVGALLPTPGASDAQGGPRALPEARTHGGTDHGPRLRDIAAALLPTPTAVHWARNATAHRSAVKPDTNDTGWTLSDIAYADLWGQYADAIARWEIVLDQPAPAPTEPGKTGAPRLASRFAEWLMGLDDGHVTAVPGLTRNQQLHLIGNGVVPLQGAVATLTSVLRKVIKP